MATKFITKGKGKRRKKIPMNSKKKGVSVRSVSLKPKAVAVINNKQIKLINKGEPATFSKALNDVILRKKRDIPVIDTNLNRTGKLKDYKFWVYDKKNDTVIKGSETIVKAPSYGQAADDFVTIWNKDKRLGRGIGYPDIQGKPVVESDIANLPVVNTKVNRDGKLKKFIFWALDFHTKSKIPKSDAIIVAEHYEQAANDYQSWWNDREHLDRTIGYPTIQGTVMGR